MGRLSLHCVTVTDTAAVEDDSCNLRAVLPGTVIVHAKRRNLLLCPPKEPEVMGCLHMTSILLQEFKLILTLLAIPMSDVATIFKVSKTTCTSSCAIR
jgi:hypothetical protein